jgi:hypothetical protein
MLIPSRLAAVAMEGVCFEFRYFAGSLENFFAQPSEQNE